MLHSFCSLDNNGVCGINPYTGEGTYTAEGINKLCEGLKTSSITSLRCADARACLGVQRPLNSN